MTMTQGYAKNAGNSTESDDFPVLRNMISGYFHQDYDVISDDSDVVVATYKEDTPVEVHLAMVQEIGQLLERYGADEEELTRAFERIFRPETSFHRFWGRTTRESLERVADIMSGKPIASSPAPTAGN